MGLDLAQRAEKSGRAASAALPFEEAVLRPPREAGADRRPSDRLFCDLCGDAQIRGERHRLVWQVDDATRVVLAELCCDCATFPDAFLARHGGRGRDAIGLVREFQVPPRRKTQPPRIFGYATRAILYVLIAVAAFVLVTLVTSGGW
jgi:hypothetical protein